MVSLLGAPRADKSMATRCFLEHFSCASAVGDPLRARRRWRLPCRAALAAGLCSQGAGMQAQPHTPSGTGNVAATEISPTPMGRARGRKAEQHGFVQIHSEWNSFSLGRGVRKAPPPGSRGSSRAPFSLGWAEGERQPNHRLCDSKPGLSNWYGWGC